MEDKAFFARDENLLVLKRLTSTLREASPVGSEATPLIKHLSQIIKVIIANAERIDELCPANIEWVGPRFIELARSIDPSDSDMESTWQEIFVLAYRFLCELEFSQAADLTIELRMVREFVDKSIDTFSAMPRSQLIYASYLMPVQIAKKLLHHPNIGVIQEFNKNISVIDEQKKKWDDEFSEREKQIATQRSKLDQLETEFNFVGLVDGFRKMIKTKTDEKKFAFGALMALAVIALTPIVGELVYVLCFLETLDSHRHQLLFAVPALLAVEVLLVYFFRIVLIHFRSLKTQLLQLELRASLCQFIQSYSSYAQEIRAKDPAALEKFENIVFSGILATEEALPATFDGADQLVKFIKSVRG